MLKISRALYTFCFALALPFVLIRLFYRSLRLPSYRRRWGERLGLSLPKLSAQEKTLWIHGVSMGESLSAFPLVETIREKFPELTLIFTTTTPTASAIVTEQLGDKVLHCYLPYDLPWIMQRFVSAIRCQLCVMLESEVWPNHLAACKKNGIPVVLLNAQLSDRTFARYQIFPKLTRRLLNHYSAIITGSENVSQRFLTLGYPKEMLSRAPNLKYATAIPASVVSSGQSLRAHWKSITNKTLWIAASTHEGEETLVLETLSALKNQGLNVLLLLVPRHPERFDGVFTECEHSAFNTLRLSQSETPTGETDILLGDCMGKLKTWYAASDIAFVGGSLMPIGGHNPLEPAALGLPIIMGPHLEYLNETRDELLAHQALVIAKDGNALTTQLSDWIQHSEKRNVYGHHAKEFFLEKHRAALNVPMQIISKILNPEVSDAP